MPRAEALLLGGAAALAVLYLFRRSLRSPTLRSRAADQRIFHEDEEQAATAGILFSVASERSSLLGTSIEGVLVDQLPHLLCVLR
tara:strand:- start:1613 stop:1867 length:255 start_codon:yes stop_codon:yes gene_type:complete